MSAILDDFTILVEKIFQSKIDYSYYYPCKVVSFNKDKQTVDIVCDNPKIGGRAGIKQVSIKYGLPGIQINANSITNGTRCMLGFEGGNPNSPFVCNFDAKDVVIEIGVGDNQFVSLSNKVDDYFRYIINYLTTHTHLTGVGESAPPKQPPEEQESTACERLKVI